MRLKQVQVHGFKTFANHTTFDFQEGITAIVGPNGCGKSNIADAIRWALGEQAPTNLRTKKTEDLIFSGSASRARMGMAEVALTLENPFAIEDVPPPPHPNGGNGSAPEPLPDDSSSFVTQSPPPVETSPTVSRTLSIVEEILRARPTEVTILRRAYRSGENEYLINRQRVRLRDVQELLQRWGLARLTYAVIGQGLIDQALSLRAEERRALFEEAAGIGLYQSKKANALEKLEETQQNLIRVNDIINEIAPRLPSLARQADRASKYESVATALDQKLRQWYAFNWAHAREGLIAAQSAEDAARERLNAQRAAMHDLAAQLAQARSNAQTLRTRLGEHRRVQQERAGELAARERDLAVLRERVGFAETQHADAQRDYAGAQDGLQAARLALENAENRRHELLLSVEPVPAPEIFPEADLDAQQGQDLAELEAQQDLRVRQFEQSAEQQRAELAQLLSALDDQAAQTEAAWLAENERLLAAQQQLEEEQRARAAAQAAERAAAREQAESARARALARQRLAVARLEEFQLSETNLASGANPAAAPDLAAHLIALQDRLPLYESAVAAVAGLAAQADELARRERAARERERLLERVRAELNEARTALALAERDVQAAYEAEARARRELERAEREWSKERERLAREREREREQARVQLQRERERLTHALERLETERAQLLREREQLLQERAREQARERERRQRERERERERLAREQEQVRLRAEQERTRLEQERARAEREVETRAARVEQFAAQISQLTAQRDALQAEVEELRAELASLAELAAPDEAALNESERLQNELENRETQLRSELTAAEELYNRAVLEAERRRAEIARLEQEIEDDLGPVELDPAAPRQLRLRLVVRARPGEQGERPSKASSADEDTEQAAILSAADEGDAGPAPEQELVVLPDVTSLPDGFDKEIRRLKNQMRYIGNVNPNAPQEYAELKERHAFLTEQASDLTLAVERIQQAILELDAMMKQKFQETFDAINVEFKKYFTLLFGGGTARLELTDPNDLIHSGIEISARPPGKRASQLVLLSGGERALTAAALIFAILRVSPTPFCVMDEVDAALDEANVGRFRDALQELARSTQFIVITHNRVTMEGARAIYGVSMGEDGVSQVLSLKLEPAA